MPRVKSDANSKFKRELAGASVHWFDEHAPDLMVQLVSAAELKELGKRANINIKRQILDMDDVAYRIVGQYAGKKTSGLIYTAKPIGYGFKAISGVMRRMGLEPGTEKEFNEAMEALAREGLVERA